MRDLLSSNPGKSVIEVEISVPDGISIEVEKDSVGNVVRFYFRDSREVVDGKRHAWVCDKAHGGSIASGDLAAKCRAADVGEFCGSRFDGDKDA